MGNIYSIAVEGSTYSGNTNFPSELTTYAPLEPFLQQGILAIETGILPGNSNTDQNVFDVGLFVGSPLDINVQAGELQWASNQALHSEFDEITGANSAQLLGIDETLQAFDPVTNTLTMTIADPNTALISQLDMFNKRSSILSTPAEVVGGTVNLQFSPDFTTVTGTATFYGNGYIEPGSSAWSANFTGVLAQTYVGLAEGSLAGAF